MPDAPGDDRERALRMLTPVKPMVGAAAVALAIALALFICAYATHQALFVFPGFVIVCSVAVVGIRGAQGRSWVRQARSLVERYPLRECSVTALAAPDGGRRRPVARAAVRIDAPAELRGSTCLLVELPLRPASRDALSRRESFAHHLVTPTSLGTYELGTRPVHAKAYLAGDPGGSVVVLGEGLESALISIKPVLHSEREALRRIGSADPDDASSDDPRC